MEASSTKIKDHIYSQNEYSKVLQPRVEARLSHVSLDRLRRLRSMSCPLCVLELLERSRYVRLGSAARLLMQSASAVISVPLRLSADRVGACRRRMLPDDRNRPSLLTSENDKSTKLRESNRSRRVDRLPSFKRSVDFRSSIRTSLRANA